MGGVQSELSQFPVYVSYPAFFAGDNAISGANESIFGVSGNSVSRALGRSSGCLG